MATANITTRHHQMKGGEEMRPMSPGAAIRIRRVALGLTQEAVAAELGITQSSYAKYEVRNQPPPRARVQGLARVLNATPSEISGGLVPMRLLHPDALRDEARSDESRTKFGLPDAVDSIVPTLLYLAEEAPDLLILVANIAQSFREQATLRNGRG